MSKEPKIDHDYHAGKDKLTITIHRYSLKSRKTRDAIIEKLLANLESKPDRLIAALRRMGPCSESEICVGRTCVGRCLAVSKWIDFMKLPAGVEPKAC